MGEGWVCSECGAVEIRFGPRSTGRIHKPGCLRGWAVMGGEFASAEGRGEARRATDEAVEADEQTLQARRNGGGT